MKRTNYRLPSAFLILALAMPVASPPARAQAGPLDWIRTLFGFPPAAGQVVVRDASGKIVSQSGVRDLNARAGVAQGQPSPAASPSAPAPQSLSLPPQSFAAEGEDGRLISPVAFTSTRLLIPSPFAREGLGWSFGDIHILARYHVVARDREGRVAWQQDVHNLVTTAGVNRLLALFEGGAQVSAESDGNTPGSGTTYSFTAGSPIVTPGTMSIVVASIGTCADQGNGTCTGTGFSGSSSTINYQTGAVALTFSSALGSAHATTSTYKQGASPDAVATAGVGGWYVGEIKGASAPTFAVGDTMASHSGWTEIAGTDVTNANRQGWTGATIASGSVDNSASQVVYNQNSTITLQGLFLVDNKTIAGTSGTLYGEAAFSSSQAVQAGYTVNITATLTITAG